MRNFYITERDRARLVRKPDMSELYTGSDYHGNVPSEQGLPDEFVEYDTGNTIISGQVYYHGHTVIYWPEDNYYEPIDDFIYILSDTEPDTGELYSAKKLGYKTNDLQKQVDVYKLVKTNSYVPSVTWTDGTNSGPVWVQALFNATDGFYLSVGGGSVEVRQTAASATTVGYITTGAQTIAGYKTFLFGSVSTQAWFTDSLTGGGWGGVDLGRVGTGSVGVKLLGTQNQFNITTNAQTNAGDQFLTVCQCEINVGNNTLSGAYFGIRGIRADAVSVPVRFSVFDDDADTWRHGATGTGSTVSVIGGIVYSVSGGGGSYTDEEAQDAVGNFSLDSDTIDVTYNDATPSFSWAVRYQMSITSDASGIKLVGDSATPGATRYYGTDSGSNKGWHDLTETVQDIVGAQITDTQSINATYDDTTGLVTLDVNVIHSIVTDAFGVRLDGDSSTPGADKFYGTNSSGVRGWYALPSGTYTDEQAQDAIGNIATNSTTVAVTYDDINDEIYWAVIYQMSIVSDALGIKLQNDSASPGSNKLYGTDGSGAKGWYDIPSGTSYTDEQAQDAVGNNCIVTNSINVIYDDTNNTFEWHLLCQMSITFDALGTKLVGDVNTPGNSKYYGTDSGGNKGWYALPSAVSYTDEEAQDAVGNISADSDTIDVTYNDATPSLSWAVKYQMSITSDASGIRLVADTDSPGNNKYYGTNAIGGKGWFALPSAVSYTDEEAQDAVGNICADSDTIDVTYNDATPSFSWAVKYQMSITSDASGVKLVGDATTPGKNKVYGTDNTGAKGWVNSPISNSACNVRISASSSDPIGEVTVGSSFIYLHPYKGNKIALYDNTNSVWVEHTLSATISVSPGAGVTNIYVYNNAGTLTLEASSTAPTLFSGVYIKTGDNTKRYIGTVYNSSGIFDNPNRRYVWNLYNQIPKPVYCFATDSNHTYSTDSWRAWDNNTTVGQTRFEFVLGLPWTVDFAAYGNAYNAAEPWAAVGIGIDTTTANNAGLRGGFRMQTTAFFKNIVSSGFHYAQLIQRAAIGSTTTWYGNAGISIPQSGLNGTIIC